MMASILSQFVIFVIIHSLNFQLSASFSIFCKNSICRQQLYSSIDKENEDPITSGKSLWMEKVEYFDLVSPVVSTSSNLRLSLGFIFIFVIRYQFFPELCLYSFCKEHFSLRVQPI